ncbi:hypothetical protein NIES4071_00040 [Calothrix sp. NIES-4071]|nr:hypothetical protein NIES4071_00040 [Calothrix sp. NIES-4071]BAZ54351.1 hypothetical protein NIES4105_00040 [Calothrix sp. NIES-4105]
MWENIVCSVCCFGMAHNLLKTPHGWMCSTCEWQWKSKPSTGCPSVPRYDYWWNQNETPPVGYRPVPDNLKTKTQLASLKLAPRDENKPNGCIYRQAKTQWLWLYDVNNTAPLQKPKRPYVSAATRRIRKEAVLLWDSGEVVTEVYRDIEISAYAEYRYYGFKSASKISKERQPYYYGFLAEVTVVGLPTLPQNYTELRAILNRSVDTHIEALEHAKILVDKLLDVGINEGMREQLSQSGSGFIMTDQRGYGFCLKLPEGLTIAHRLAVHFGWEVIEA